MARIAELLKSLEDLCEVINNLDFGKPGIFTNAIINKPDVTRLIRDPSSAEQSLYKISRKQGTGSLLLRSKDDPSSQQKLVSLLPERQDGFSVYDSEETDTDNKTVVPQLRFKRNFSDDPESQHYNDMSPISKRKAVGQYNLIPQEVLNSDDFSTILNAIQEVTSKYPNLVNDFKMPETLESLQSQYLQLSKQTAELESAVASQKQELSVYGNELEFGSPVRDIHELIRTEERMIADLEAQLSNEE